MRFVVYAALLSLVPYGVHAEVFGDFTGGGEVSNAPGSVGWHLGARDGAQTKQIGFVLGAGWTYMRAHPDSESATYESHFRGLGKLAIPSRLSEQNTLVVLLGGGVDVTRMARASTISYDTGWMLEGGLLVLADMGGYELGVETNVAFTAHDDASFESQPLDRKLIDFALVARFAH